MHEMRRFTTILEAMTEAAKPRLPRAGKIPYWMAPLAPLTKKMRDFQGWSWVTGGCFAFAEALHAVFGGELWGVCSHEGGGDDEDFPVEHAVVKIKGKFYDYRGVIDIESYMRELRRKLQRPLFLKPKTDPSVFWFEDDFFDDGDMKFLLAVMQGKRTSKLRCNDLFVQIGNDITIRVSSKRIDGVDGVFITMTGPHSEMTNHITWLEADNLHDLLGILLAGSA